MRPLDFIVFGIGRSGTTGLGQALNMHPDILCGIERFHYKADPAMIMVPQSFEDSSFKCNALLIGPNLELVKEKGADVSFIGNKNPRYFCNLEAWHQFKPDLRKVAIYRSPYEYLASWKTRADNPADSWHSDMQGVFGIYELFGMLRALLEHADDTLMVPFDAFYFGNGQTILDVIDHIGANASRYPHDEFLKTLRHDPKQPRKRPELPGDVAEMLDVANFDAIDRILMRDEVYRIADVRSSIEDWLQSIPPRLGELAEQWIVARESDSLHKLMLYWVRHFPHLDAMPNSAALPGTFRLYRDFVFSEGFTKWTAAITMAKRTNTSPLNSIIQALSGKPPPPNSDMTRYLVHQSRRAIGRAMASRTGT